MGHPAFVAGVAKTAGHSARSQGVEFRGWYPERNQLIVNLGPHA